MSKLVRSDAERDLVDTARRVLPGGTFGNFPGDIVIRSGNAGRVTDVSGNEYVDYLLGSGPMFVGHNHPEVNAAVQEQLGRGSTFFANNEYGIRLAEAIVDAMACAEQVRFGSSGTEADFYAMRLVRAYRKRDKILKFEGGYHGMSDYGLMSLWPKRPGNFPVAAPDSAGIPDAIRQEMIVAPYNDLEAATALIREHHDELAGVIMEPFQRLVPPKPGFLEGMRAITEEYGIPLIFDEVVTGFRFAYGGAQELYGVVPDVCTLGKIIGGGYPLSAVAGKAEIMKHFDKAAVGDDAFMPQIGTLSGNPVAAVAGLATLEILKRPGAYDGVYQTGRTLMEGLQGALDNAGIAARVVGSPVMFDAIFAAGEVHDYRGMLAGDPAKAKTFNQAMRENGVFKGEGKTYLSTAHDAADVKVTLAAYEEAAKAVAAMG
ncbi:glutamate-1-semialdehyde 2,1-aminomutase [Constrictibacter sp. MBR-5]|jgi:glutamate-1-semialdehyde 2,1-aminomutase|uniref:aspartate aminotransferase family protein n=1 Tax=Constrictibacter sp. MBR-5 TaxID=3156467 RepID=UPI00339235B3